MPIICDVLVFSESWLNPNISDDTINIEKIMPPFRTDRVGGGVVTSVRDCLTCKRRANMEFRSCLGVALCIMQT